MGEGGDRANLPVEDIQDKDPKEQAGDALRNDAELVPAKPGDSQLEKKAEGAATEPRDFKPHLAAAVQAQAQWEALAGAEGKVSVQDAAGAVHEVDAKTYRGQLEEFIVKQYETAIEATNSMPRELLEKMENRIFSPENNKKIAGLLEKYGLDKEESISVQAIKDRQSKTENLDEFMELESLQDMVGERVFAKQIVHAHGNVSVHYADFLLKQNEPKKAKDLLMDAAARDPELRYDRNVFRPLREQAEQMLLDRSHLAVKTEDNPLAYMQAAQQMVQQGDKDSADKFFKKAVEIADGMPVKEKLAEIDSDIAQNSKQLDELKKQHPEAGRQYDAMDKEANDIVLEQQRLLKLPEAERKQEEVTRLQERIKKLDEQSVKFESEVEGGDKISDLGRQKRFLTEQRGNWEVFDKVDSTSRWQYAQFLLDKSNEGRPNRYKDAQKLLEHVEEDDPEIIVLQGAEYLNLKAQAKSEGKLGSSISERYGKAIGHLQEMQTEAKKGENGGEPNIGKIKSELWNAYREVNDPAFRKETLDQWRRTNELIKEEKRKPESEQDKENLKIWEAQREEYDQMYNQGGLILAQMAAIEGSMENRSAGRQYMEMLDRDYPELNKYSKWNYLKLDNTREMTRELAWYESAWKWTKDNAVEIGASVASVVAGVGTFAVLTGSTLGFGAPVGVAGGIVAGAAAGSAVRAAFGKEVTLGTVVMDGLGGASGGLAVVGRGAMATRAALSAEAMVTRSGLQVGATQGMSAWARREAAMTLLRESGKIGATRAAVSNFAWRGAVNTATGFSFSAPFRAGTTYNNYYEGRYNSLGDAAKDYAAGVGTDTAAAFVGGTYLSYGFKVGAPTSAALHISREALLGNSKNNYEFGANVMDGMTNDLFAAWTMQLGVGLAGKVPVARSLPLEGAGVGAMPAVRGSMYAPMWKDLYNGLNPAYNLENKPKRKGEEP